MNTQKLLATLVSAMTLAGCGEGGADAGATLTPPVQTVPPVPAPPAPAPAPNPPPPAPPPPPPPPTTLIDAPHGWDFSAYKIDAGDPRYPEQGREVASSNGYLQGAFHAEHDFVTSMTQVPAKGTVEATAPGFTYLLEDQAPVGVPENGDDIGSAAHFYQRQAFRKNAPDAKLTLHVTNLRLFVFDGNTEEPNQQDCGDWWLLDDPQAGEWHCWEALFAQATLNLKAFDVTGNLHYEGMGEVYLHGWFQHWSHFAMNVHQGATRVIWPGDLQYREIDYKTLKNMAAEVTLAYPVDIDIPIDAVPVNGNFMLVTDARVVAYNRRQRESAVTADFRDPQSTDGIVVTYEGLEPIPVYTDDDPVFPPPPPPECTTGYDPAAGTVQFGVPKVDAGESSLAAFVPVTRAGGEQGELLVRFRTRGGTATASDYVPQDEPVYFADGDAETRVVSIPLKDNAVEQPARDLALELVDLQGCGRLGTPAEIPMVIYDDDAPPPPPPTTWSVGGVVSGLAGTGLVLRDFGKSADLGITRNGPYEFDDLRLPGTAYDVRVAQQPTAPLQQCTVENATGTVGDANVVDVNVTCVTPSASPGLDPTFGTEGKVVGDLRGKAVALQADGKIVVAGWRNGGAQLSRYNTDGTLDAGFGAGGHVDVTLAGGSNDEINTLIVQSDGKILASGIMLNTATRNDDFVVLRFNSDGSADAGFGGNGRALTDFGVQGADRARDMLLQPDGRIVLVGTESHATGGAYGEANFAAARYNSDGTLDAGFGNGGLAVSKLTGYALNGTAGVLQSNGTLVIAGQARPNGGSFNDTALTQLLPDGRVDGSYGSNGVLRANLYTSGDDYPTDAVIMPENKVMLSLLAGPNGSRDFTLARFTPDGHLDSGFSSTGYKSVSLGAANDVARRMVLDASGRIIAVGDSAESSNGSDFAIARFDVDGNLDTTFGYNGALKTDFFGADDSANGGVVVQGDGNIVAVGVAVSGAVAKLGMIRALPVGRASGPS